MEPNNEAFEYTYSPAQQAEIKEIRKKYLPKEEDKMEQLRKLDKNATARGTKMSILVGTVSSLIMGTGMSCCMVWTDSLLIPGILIGIVGLLGVAAAYPLYLHITKKERERIAPEILRLSEELLKS